MQIHPLSPIMDINTKILILGSFPSIKSRGEVFYYAHPQNRFWKVLAKVVEDELPITNEEKIKFLCRHHIGLWDIVHSCEIKGSSDASIRDVKVNDIQQLTRGSSIELIVLHGKTAANLFKKYVNLDVRTVCVPSTSPANAAMSLEKLTIVWKENLKSSII